MVAKKKPEKVLKAEKILGEKGISDGKVKLIKKGVKNIFLQVEINGRQITTTTDDGWEEILNKQISKFKNKK